MFKKMLAVMTLGSALLLTPSPGLAKERDHYHRHRFSVMFGITPRHYVDGYYDRMGYFHPSGRGAYDMDGRWYPVR